MESIPNEVIEHIISSLNKNDIPNLRLVSHRFNQLAIPFVQKLFRVDFIDPSDTLQFISDFENLAMLPFQKFGFEETLLCYPQCKFREPLQQFCSNFGKFVKVWEFVPSCPMNEDFMSDNVKIILENCENVEEFCHYVLKNELGVGAKLPLLNNLHTINVTYHKKVPTAHHNFLPLLDQMLKNAPNLRSTSVKSQCVTSVTRGLNQLHRTAGGLRVKLDTVLHIPAKMEEFRNLIAVSTEMKVVDLTLELELLKDSDSKLVHETIDILSKWIEKLPFLRRLSLSLVHYGINRDDAFPIALSLPNLACLKFLLVSGLNIPVDRLKQMEFPVLTELDCTNCNITNKLSFVGCVFPNVKSARIVLKTEEEIKNWPQVIPNVEDMKLISLTLEGIFGFPKLRKLEIQIEASNGDEAVLRSHWNQLTGGAEYMTKVIDVEVPMQTLESRASFRNLPFLTHLRFSWDTQECWKGVLYASKTGQLSRLQSVQFSTTDYFYLHHRYREELMRYHNEVLFP